MIGHKLLSFVKWLCTHIHQDGKTKLLPSMERHCTHIHQHGRTHLLPYVERNCTYNHQHDRTHLLSSVKRISTYNHLHDRTQLLSSMERHNTHIHQHGRTHLLPSVERQALTSTSMIGQTYYHLWKGSTLTSDHVGTNPTVTLEWISVLDWGFLITDQVPPFKEWKHPLYLIKWEHIPQSHQNGHALISDHVRTHLIVIS